LHVLQFPLSGAQVRQAASQEAQVVPVEWVPAGQAEQVPLMV